MKVTARKLMFSYFNKTVPQVSIFHNPSSSPSNKALYLLRASLTDPYPPNSSSKGPLNFNLEVVEAPPTSDQLSTILSYVRGSANILPASKLFLSAAHPSSPGLDDQPNSLKGITELAKADPKSVKWPIVVNWDAGKASIGNVEGVKDILEGLRQLRDGK